MSSETFEVQIGGHTLSVPRVFVDRFQKLVPHLGLVLVGYSVMWNWLPSGMWFLGMTLIQIAGFVFTYFRLAKYIVKEEKTSNSSKSISINNSNSVGVEEQKSRDSTSSLNPRLTRALSVFQKINAPTINPFINETWKIDEDERLRICLMTVTLAPIRFGSVVLILFIAALFAAFAVRGLSMSDLQHPLSPDRRRFIEPIRYLARAILFVCGYYWIPTKGEKAEAKDAPIVVANHVSFLDPFYMVAAYLPSPVGAAEHLKMPLVGAIVKALQTVTVDRKSATSRKDVLNTMIERGKNSKWPHIVIFPEGTCTNGRSMITFKNGAFVPGLPVQPVLLSYKGRIDPSWVNCGPSQLNLIMRVLCEPVNHLEIEFLPPYVPNEVEKKDANIFAKNVRAKMCAVMGIDPTEYSFEDILLQTKAAELHFPPDRVAVEFKRIQEMLNISLEGAQHQLEVFSKLNKRNTGTVNLEEFLAAYGVTDSPELENLFHLLDANDTGEIDFRAYLIGLGTVSETMDKNSMIRLAFRMCDLDGDDKVALEDLQRVMKRVFDTMTEDQLKETLSGIELGADGLIDFDTFAKFAHTDPRYIETFSKTVL